MGSGGHNVKPTSQKKKEGTSRPDRDAGRVETIVKPVSQIPPAPKHFDRRHTAKWKECCKLLIESNVLALHDTDAIQFYVETWFLAADAYQDVIESGMTMVVETKRGVIKITNPSVRQYQDCQKILKPLMEQFGFTPKSRMSLRVEKKNEKPQSAVLALLSGPSRAAKTGSI